MMKKILILILTLLLKYNILEISEFKLDINPIAPIYWISNEEIFVNEEDIAYIYNVKDREILNKYVKKDEEIYGYENNQIFICKTENRVRNSIDEYSTHLVKLDPNRKVVLDIELKPTLEVVECRDNIVLKSIFPIEEKFFIFTDDLYPLERYNQGIHSPNLRYFLEIDDLGEYNIRKYNLSFP